jgi:hypothetical protein
VADQVLLVVGAVPLVVFVTAAGLAAVVVGAVASAVGEGVVEELLGEEGEVVALAVLQLDVQTRGHLGHPRQPALGHLS